MNDEVKERKIERTIETKLDVCVFHVPFITPILETQDSLVHMSSLTCGRTVDSVTPEWTVRESGKER